MKAGVERRRFRRAELDVPVTVRALNNQESSAASAESIVGQAKNISLAGVYCHVKTPCALTAGQSVICSVVIPEEQIRWFPFARVTGKGSVIRTEPLASGRRSGDSQTEDRLIGMAIAFASDVTALGALEWY